MRALPRATSPETMAVGPLIDLISGCHDGHFVASPTRARIVAGSQEARRLPLSVKVLLTGSVYVRANFVHGYRQSGERDNLRS